MNNTLKCPTVIPQEIWNSHLECFGKDKTAEKWKAHIRLHLSYVQDANHNFLKDDQGNWLRKDPDATDCSFPICNCRFVGNKTPRCTNPSKYWPEGAGKEDLP